MRVSSECVLDNVIDFRGSAIENMYRVRELTEGAFLHYCWLALSSKREEKCRGPLSHFDCVCYFGVGCAGAGQHT